MDKVICIVDGLDGFDFGKEYSMITAMGSSFVCVYNNSGNLYVFSEDLRSYNYIWKSFLLKSQFREDKIDSILNG